MTSGGLVDAVRVDVRRLHETWMELVFPRQRGAADTVLGKYRPDSALGMAGYRAWGVVGALVVAVLYPLAVLGFAARFYARKLDSAATRLGLAGVVLLTALVWGGLTVVSLFRVPLQEVIAIGAAGAVATVSAGLAVVFKRVDGRPTTVLLSYPFAVTAILLPPITAALLLPTLSSVVVPVSEDVADWILDNLLSVGGIAEYLREQFELRGPSVLLLWFGVATPVGWLLGGLVTLANVVRPSGE